MVKSNRAGRSWKWPLVWITGIAFALAGRAAAQQPAEIIVRNGLIVTAEGRMEADVRIRGEKIAEIGRDLASSAGEREIDAHGMLLLPGAVDTHTHLNPEMPDPPRPQANQDDYISGSAAAFAAGATTVSNFIPVQPDEDVSAYALRVTGAIEKSAMADVFIHVTVGNDPARFTREMLDELAGRGFVSTGENFLARESFDLNALAWLKLFKASGPAGVLSMLHAEDYSIMAEAQERLMAEGRGSIHNFGQSARSSQRWLPCSERWRLRRRLVRPSTYSTCHPDVRRGWRKRRWPAVCRCTSRRGPCTCT